jgi:hypothetical protein
LFVRRTTVQRNNGLIELRNRQRNSPAGRFNIALIRASGPPAYPMRERAIAYAFDTLITARIRFARSRAIAAGGTKPPYIMCRYMSSDLSLFVHPLGSRARPSFAPCWLGDVTGVGRGAPRAGVLVRSPMREPAFAIGQDLVKLIAEKIEFKGRWDVLKTLSPDRLNALRKGRGDLVHSSMKPVLNNGNS